MFANKFDSFIYFHRQDAVVIVRPRNIAGNLLEMHDKSNRQHRKIAVCGSTQLKNYSNYIGKGKKESAKTFE